MVGEDVTPQSDSRARMTPLRLALVWLLRHGEPSRTVPLLRAVRADLGSGGLSLKDVLCELHALRDEGLVIKSENVRGDWFWRSASAVAQSRRVA
jgi:hypothetical protein